jgi:hypothetical protein
MLQLDLDPCERVTTAAAMTRCGRRAGPRGTPGAHATRRVPSWFVPVLLSKGFAAAHMRTMCGRTRGR